MKKVKCTKTNQTEMRSQKPPEAVSEVVRLKISLPPDPPSHAIIVLSSIVFPPTEKYFVGYTLSHVTLYSCHTCTYMYKLTSSVFQTH